MQTVTSSYLDGIRDERALLRQCIADGETDLAALARDMLDNIERTIEQGWSGPMADYMRGVVGFYASSVAEARRELAKLEATA